jgi:hypothetical protein
MAGTPADPAHRWRFYRAGGVDQVRLDRGADILHLDQLDQKLWMALSCPVKGLEFDERTLALLDADGDGSIRPPEILAAIRWLALVIRDPDELVKGEDGVPLASIRTDTPEGERVLTSARHILAGLGRDAQRITVGDSTQTTASFSRAHRNGDGIVPPESIADAGARRVAQEIVESFGGERDRSGAAGIDAASVGRFFADCEAYSAWQAEAQNRTDAVLPLGAATAEAFEVLEAVRAKIDDYFGRCRLAVFDARARAAVNRAESAYLDILASDLSIDAAEVAHFPVALVEPGKPLPLAEGVNPAWVGPLGRFRDACVAPALGRDKTTLTEAEWTGLCATFEPHRAWHAAARGESVAGLGLERVREVLAGPARAVLESEIAADLAVAPQVEAIAEVEKLARLYRDLHTLLNNYVSFTDFYARRKAIFQVGTLHLDGRSCDLCVHVNDLARHGALAAMARTFLAYVDCTRPGGEKVTIACAFTAGDGDNLFVGRNGIFYDRKGRDWNATIARIVDNPISIGQAFWAPYKKVLRWIEEQVAKRAAAADEAATTRLQATAVGAATAAQTGTATAQKPKFDVGMIAALGVAVGGITAAMGALLQVFFGLGFWMPLGVVGLVLLISGPSMVIAWLKLRQRNLGPILDANGWAVNTLARINIPLGRSLTAVPTLPPGASRSLKDPYAPRKIPWAALLLVPLVLATAGWGLWRMGYVHRWWPGCPLPEPPRSAGSADGEGPTERPVD